MSDTVRQNTQLNRFELDVGGQMAVANYRFEGDIIAFTHTEVPPEMRGRGIASRLVAEALQLARGKGLKVRARCDFVATYLAKHPEYNDLVAPR